MTQVTSDNASLWPRMPDGTGAATNNNAAYTNQGKIGPVLGAPGFYQFSGFPTLQSLANERFFQVAEPEEVDEQGVAQFELGSTVQCVSFYDTLFKDTEYADMGPQKESAKMAAGVRFGKGLQRGAVRASHQTGELYALLTAAPGDGYLQTSCHFIFCPTGSEFHVFSINDTGEATPLLAAGPEQTHFHTQMRSLIENRPATDVEKAFPDLNCSVM